MDELPFAGKVCLTRKLPVESLDPDLPIGFSRPIRKWNRKFINEILQSSEMPDLFPSPTSGPDKIKKRLLQESPWRSSPPQCLCCSKSSRDLNAPFPLPSAWKCLDSFQLILPAIFPWFGSLFLQGSLTPYFLVCLSVLCMLWVLCPQFLYQIHVTAAQMTLLCIYFQIYLFIWRATGRIVLKVKSQIWIQVLDG